MGAIISHNSFYETNSKYLLGSPHPSVMQNIEEQHFFTFASSPTDPHMRLTRPFTLVLGMLLTNAAQPQGWEYTRGSANYGSLHEAESAIHNGIGGRNHQLAFPILAESLAKLDYRVAGSFVIGARRPPIPPTHRIYGAMSPTTGLFYPIPGCTSFGPSGWCQDEATLRAAWIAFKATAPAGGCTNTANPAPTGTYASFPTGVVLTNQAAPETAAEYPNNSELHGGAVDYRKTGSGRRQWQPTFQCPHPGGGTFSITETFILIQREHFFCPENWRLNTAGGLHPGTTTTEILKDRCIAQVGGLESGLSSSNESLRSGEQIFDKEIIDGPPRDGDPPCPEGNPCSALTGKKTATEFDFDSSGIDFHRYYDSVFENRDYGNLGRGWSHSFSDRILTTHLTANHGDSSCSLAYLQNEQGGMDVFKNSGSGKLYSANNSEDVLLCTTGPEPWKLLRADGTQRIYNGDGYPIAIRYPETPQRNLILTWANETALDGNLEPIEYGPRRLVRVENSVGRALIFNYFSEGDHRLRNITDHAGTVLAEYVYTNLGAPAMPVGAIRPYAIGQLFEARTSDSIRRYQYDHRDLLTKIQEVSANNVATDFATYTYDTAGRGLTSQHGAGAGLTTFIYTANAAQSSVVIDSGATATFTQDLSRYRRPLTASKGSGAHRRMTTFTYAPTSGRTQTRTVRIDDSTNTTTRHIYGSDWLRPTAIVEAEGTLEERTTRYTWNSERNSPTSNSIERCNRSSVGQPCAPVVEFIERRAYGPQQQLTALCRVDPAVPAAVTYVCGSTEHAPAGVRQSRFSYCPTALGTAACPFAGWLMSVDGPRTDVADVTTFEYRTETPASCVSAPTTCPYRKGDLFAEVNALGHRKEILSYDPAGRVLRRKDANSVLTDLTWHPRGWQLSETVRADLSGTANAADAVHSMTYERFGDLRRATGPDGDYVEYCYDSAQRVTALVLTPGTCNGTATPTGGDAVLYTLRADGKRVVERTINSSGTLFRRLSRQYDDLGLLLTERDSRDETTGNTLAPADALLPDRGRRIAAYSYDGRGLRINLEDGRQLLPTNDPFNFSGRSTDYTFDALGRALAISDAQGLDSAPATRGKTEFKYNARDLVVQVTDPNLLVTRYTYNGLGDLLQIDSPDSGTTTFLYDSAGNAISKTDARNVVTLSSYDALNRLTQTGYITSVNNPGTNTYTYDLSNTTSGCSSSGATATFPVGRLSRMVDPSGVTTYCHDRRGNLLRKSQVDTLFSPTATEILYTYTKADRLASITYPSGARVDYSRDAEGQINAIHRVASGSSTPLVSSASYSPAGPLIAMTFGNGDTLSKNFDQNLFPTAISNTTATQNTNLSLQYLTDVVGNINRVTQIAGGSVQVQRFAYDSVYRLQAVQTNGGAPIEQYTYDKTGNRLSKQYGAQPILSYTYNNSPGTPVLPNNPAYSSYSHRLLAIGSELHEYDTNGNLINIGNGLSHAFDARNRSTNFSAVSTQGADSSSQYNGHGERTKHTTEVSYNGIRSQFYYDESGQTLARYDVTFSDNASSVNPSSAKAVPSNATAQEYIWLDDIPVAVYHKANGSDVQQIAFLSTDHLNTPRLARVGSVDVWRWDLVSGNTSSGTPVAAFGQAQPQLQTINISLRFPGQVYDSLSGLHYNYFRDYQPATGRYTQSDPFGLYGGINTYSYGAQNPLSVVDDQGTHPGVGGIIKFCMRFPMICWPFPTPPPKTPAGPSGWPPTFPDPSQTYCTRNPAACAIPPPPTNPWCFDDPPASDGPDDGGTPPSNDDPADDRSESNPGGKSKGGGKGGDKGKGKGGDKGKGKGGDKGKGSDDPKGAHKNNARPSTEGKHQKADERRKRDQRTNTGGGEKGDKRRKPSYWR